MSRPGFLRLEGLEYSRFESQDLVCDGTGPDLNIRIKPDLRYLDARKVLALGSDKEGPVQVQVYGYKILDEEDHYICPDPEFPEQVQKDDKLFREGILFKTRRILYLTQEQYKACKIE